MRKMQDKLLKAGWGGIAENTWTSRGQSSDCQLANLWIGEVETNCRIVFCLVNPPTIKIPPLQYIATKHFLELAAKFFVLQIPIAFHDLATSSLHCGFVLEFFETCICFFLCLDDIVNLCLSFLFQERQKGAEKMRAGLSPTN